MSRLAVVCLALSLLAALADAYAPNSGSAPGILLNAMDALGSFSSLQRRTLLGKLHDIYIDTSEQLCGLTAEQWSEDLYLPASLQAELNSMGYHANDAAELRGPLPRRPALPASQVGQGNRRVKQAPVSRRTARRLRSEHGVHTSHARKLLMLTGNDSSEVEDTEAGVPYRDTNGTETNGLNGFMVSPFFCLFAFSVSVFSIVSHLYTSFNLCSHCALRTFTPLGWSAEGLRF